MFADLQTFLDVWAEEVDATARVLDALTDASLEQPVAPGHRTLGRLAWHVVLTLPEMLGRTGLRVAGPGEHDPPPVAAQEIADTYRRSAGSLAHEIRTQWTDASLDETDDMYGQTWTRASTLRALVLHQAHHRGQLTVLMRQAGLTVPGIYGPSREEWEQMGMKPPAI